MLYVDTLTRLLNDDSILNWSSGCEVSGVCVSVTASIAGHGGGEGVGESRVDWGRGYGRGYGDGSSSGSRDTLGGGGGEGRSLRSWQETFTVTSPGVV